MKIDRAVPTSCANMNADSLFRRLRKLPVCQRAAGRWLEPLAPQRWVFVLGCYNSGTSLLARLLSRHPHCSGAGNEGVVLTTELRRPEDFGWPRLWIRCADKLDAPTDPKDAQRCADTIKRQWRISFDHQSPCLVEKSISNATRIEFLAKHFTPVTFIHIVRDGVPVAEGIQRKAKPARYNNPEQLERYPLNLCIEQWVKANQTIIDAKHSLNANTRFLTISYEQLCAQPMEILARCFQAADLECGDATVQRLLSEETAPIINQNRCSYESLKPSEIDYLQGVVSDKMTAWQLSSNIPYAVD